MLRSDELRKGEFAIFKRKLRAAEDAVLAERRRTAELNSAMSSAHTVRKAALPRSMQERGA
jgi:hypothetical protein